MPLSEYYINEEDNLNPKYTFETFIVGPFNDLAFAAADAVVKNPGLSYNPFFIYGDTGRRKDTSHASHRKSDKKNTSEQKNLLS